jgi:type I restriction enzyme S subunit
MSNAVLSGKYATYPEYKNSGVEWLGDVPSHWRAKQLKFMCSFNDEVLTEMVGSDYEIEYIDIGSVSASAGVMKTEKMSFCKAPSRARRIVRDGDVIISTVRTYLEAIAPIDNPPNNLIVSTGFAVIRPNYQLFKGYAAYCLRANGFIKEVVAESVGVSYPAINATDLVNIKVPALPYEEQTQIANFLDHETAKIDTLIDKQQQLIKLLKEKRQAVISHAVTKGLNPDAAMKDSGVEWLGEVPKHWGVGRIKNLAKIESGHTPSRSTERYWVDCNIPWVSLNDSQTLKVVDYIDDTTYQISELGMENSSAHLLPERAVVFTRDASIGLSAITTKPMAVSQHIIAWVCDLDRLYPEFLLLIFYAMESEFDRYTTGATLKTIGMSNVRSLSAAYPCLNEQIKIVEWAFKQIENIKLSVSKAEQLIVLLQERRTALISAAVTGKIDVRHFSLEDGNVSASQEVAMETST